MDYLFCSKNISDGQNVTFPTLSVEQTANYRQYIRKFLLMVVCFEKIKYLPTHGKYLTFY